MAFVSPNKLKKSSKPQAKTEEEWITQEEKKALGKNLPQEKEREIPFTVRIPESLFNRLNVFMETKAMRKESKNAVFLTGLEQFLSERDC